MTISLEKLQQVTDKVFFFAMKKEYQSLVDEASQIFTNTRDAESIYSSEFGFNQWVIHDFKFYDGNTTFLELYKLQNTLENEEIEMIEMMKKSRLSIFEIRKGKAGVFIKDILTKIDYPIIEDGALAMLDETAIHLFRIYPYQGKWVVQLEGGVLDKAFLDTLYRTLMDHYSEYSKYNGVIEIDKYVYSVPLLIYKLIEIIEDIEMGEMGEGENYTVYQCIYLYPVLKEILKMMDEMPEAQLSIAEEDIYIYRLMNPSDTNEQIAEIVLAENRMEIECLTEPDRKLAKITIENFFGKNVAHVKDETVDIDHLLGAMDE